MRKYEAPFDAEPRRCRFDAIDAHVVEYRSMASGLIWVSGTRFPGSGQKLVDEDGGDDDDVQEYHQQKHHEREPSEPAGMLTVTPLLRYGGCLHGIDGMN